MYGSGPDDGDVLAMGPDKPRRTWTIGGRTRRVLVAAGVCALLAVGGAVAADRLSAPSSAQRALARLVTEVTTVPVSETAFPLPVPTTVSNVGAAAAGRADGKPEVLYVDDGYCPFCIAENWALIVALSRFGQFSGLRTSRSLAFEDVPPVDGWTFYGSSYASPYLTFVPVENHSSVLVSPKAPPGAAASYRVLQRLTPAEEAAFAQLDPRRQTPFLDFGGQAELIGAGFSPYALVDLSWSQIAGDLRIPLSQPGITILGAADTLTTELCQLTGDRPADACSP
jgi:hypothetical protein